MEKNRLIRACDGSFAARSAENHHSSSSLARDCSAAATGRGE